MINRILLSLLTLMIFSASLTSQINKFAATDYSGGKVFIMENNKIIWQHPAPNSNDLWVLKNGNILFTTGNGVLEVTLNNDTIFEYTSKSNIFACQRLKNGNTFIAECNTGKLLEISPKGKVIKEVCILNDKNNDAGFAFMRNARRLDNGHFLIAHYGEQRVSEYDKSGKLVWNIDVPGGPHSVIKLKNGDTYIAVADKDNNPRIIKVNKKKEIVWQLSNDDIPGKPLKFIGGMHLLKDGSLMFANWVGHENPESPVHILRVDKNKTIISTIGKYDGINTVSSVYVIGDESSQTH
ncbi:MAG: hypothetical protein Q4F97_12580 [Bacteroidales bacterium]|nr:hypothetical protein [Bacteroidales bacterium]